MDTKESLIADEDCLKRPKEKCRMSDNQYDERKSACNKHAGRFLHMDNRTQQAHRDPADVHAMVRATRAGDGTNRN